MNAKYLKLFGFLLIVAGAVLLISQNTTLQVAPDYCNPQFPNELYEEYNDYEIWACTDTSFDPQKGLVHQSIYYEKTHPNESWSYDVVDVESWIDANLPYDGNGDDDDGNDDSGDDGCPFCRIPLWFSVAIIAVGCFILYSVHIMDTTRK